jgi:hypothetical protein
MTGILSKYSRKENASHADFTGSILTNDDKYGLNGWVKDGKDGKTFPEPIGSPCRKRRRAEASG